MNRKYNYIKLINIHLKLCLLIIAVLICLAKVNAQSGSINANYKKNPVWIQMMNDTSANYYETIKAFREYFRDRLLPKEPLEKDGADSFEKAIGLEENEGEIYKDKDKDKDKRKRKNEPALSAEVRAFKGWFYSIQPWVLDDGRIVGPIEQQAIIDKQQYELKTIEKANNK